MHRGRPAGWHDPAFVALCDAFQDAERAVGDRSAVRLGWAALRFVRYLGSATRLRRMSVHLSPSPVGRLLQQWLERRRVGVPVGRWCVASMDVPDRLDRYVAGRHRQALRNNLHRADKAALTYEHLHDPADVGAALATFFCDEMGVDWHTWLRNDHLLRERTALADAVVARLDERVVGVSVLLVDTSVAFLYMSHVTHRGTPAGLRYRLHVEVLDMLRARRVRVLVVDNVLQLPGGLRYFQQRLGFEPANLRIVPLRGERPEGEGRIDLASPRSPDPAGGIRSSAGAVLAARRRPRAP